MEPDRYLDPAVLRDRAEGRSVLVGVCGGIAAYKVCTVVSRLAQAGAEVTVAMTPSATKFVTPLTFQALSGRPVYTSQWEHTEAHDPQHISLADRAAVALLAPCTMNTVAKLAMGMTPDVVTLIVSAIRRDRTPVLVAPAMNDAMYDQPSTRRHLEQLHADGYGVIDPASGWQACRHIGQGRLPEPEVLLEAVYRSLAADG